MRRFPVRLQGTQKIPLVSEWRQRATADEAQIAAWSREFPGCAWGCATGESGLFVIDIDPDGVHEWGRMLADDAELRAAVASTLQVRTPRGGWHVYFRGEGPTGASRIARGIDTRGAGGFVVLPPAKAAHGAYEVVGGREIQVLPAHVVPRYLGARPRLVAVDGIAAKLDEPHNLERARQWLQEQVARGAVAIEGCGGNNLTYQTAAVVLELGVSPLKAHELMLAEWNAACQPPWSPEELETLVDNAAKYGEETRGGKAVASNTDTFDAAAWQAQVPAPPEPRYRLLSLPEARQNIRPETWLVPKLLPAEGTGLLVGKTGSYKSFLALDLALALASGHGHHWGPLGGAGRPVVYMAGESYHGLIGRRTDAWLATHGQEAPERMHVVRGVPPAIDKDGWGALAEPLRQLRPALIVIDTLARLMNGLDENLAKDATAVTGLMEGLARETGAFVLAIHHTGKDESKGSRGSSAFSANLDSEILIRRDDQNTVHLRVKMHKEADVEGAAWTLAPKEAAQSIVLLPVAGGTEAVVTSTAVITSADVERVLATLEPDATITTTELIDLLSREHDIPVAIVRRRLRERDVAHLNKGGRWAAPAW